MKWKKYLDKKETCGILLADLSKAFVCLPHKLLLVKINEQDFGELSPVFMIKKKDLIQGTNILQSSILGLLLFDIFFCIFLPNIVMASYLDNNTHYTMSK